MENCLPMSIVAIGITIMLISVGIFLFNYKPNRNISKLNTSWQISTDPDFNKKLYSFWNIRSCHNCEYCILCN